MPLSLVTCLLVLAVLVAQADVAAGVVVAIIATFLELLLPAFLQPRDPGQIIDGQVTEQ